VVRGKEVESETLSRCDRTAMGEHLAECALRSPNLALRPGWRFLIAQARLIELIGQLQKEPES
jgi:hypothetical protein